MHLVRITASLVMLGLAASVLADEDSLARFQWNQRPLLVFAPHPTDPRLEALLHRLAMRDCAVRDRDLVVGLMVEDGESRIAGSRVSPATARDIRQRYGVRDGAFVVILVGKDGGEKFREEDIPDLDGIFALIDGMPMRRDEMLRRNDPCKE